VLVQTLFLKEGRMMRLKSILWTAGVLLIGLFEVGSASAASITFQEGVSPAGYNVQDIWIRSSQPATNQATNDLVVGKTTSPETFRSLFGFDLTALKNVVVPPGQELQIDAVSLTLSYGAGPGGTGAGDSISMTLASYAYPFTETTATWNAPGSGAPAGGSPASGQALSVTGTFDPTPATSPQAALFGTTNEFEAQIASVLSTASPVFYGIVYSPGAEAGISTSFARIYSSDRNYSPLTSAVRPKLIVDYSFAAVPEPAGLSVVVAFGLLLARRRTASGSCSI
jgi:hypothetical protein